MNNAFLAILTVGTISSIWCLYFIFKAQLKRNLERPNNAAQTPFSSKRERNIWLAIFSVAIAVGCVCAVHTVTSTSAFQLAWGWASAVLIWFGVVGIWHGLQTLSVNASSAKP